jgi:hypothetical protein
MKNVGAIGQINFNGKKYELSVKGKVLVRSASLSYLERLVAEQKHPKILQHKVKATQLVTSAPSMITVDGKALVAPEFTVDERFNFLGQLIDMVVNGTSKSILITGQGGIGKTHEVLEKLSERGKISKNSLVPSIADLDQVLQVTDTEEEMKQKALAKMIKKKEHDYFVVKGYTSAVGLFRILFENRKKIIVFDDCDYVLKDATSIDLLKAALDSYDERWISWNVERTGMSDLPTTFRFYGSVIFISNMKMDKIDEAARTRCLKVDVSMTKQQRIERMRSVINKVMPHVDLIYKEEALALMEANIDISKSIDFRGFMNIISIRIDPLRENDWEKLARFALTQN